MRGSVQEFCPESVKGLPCPALRHWFFLGRPKATRALGERRAGPLVSAAVATQREGGKAGPDQGGLGTNTVAFPWRYRYAGWGSGQCPVSTRRVRSDLPGQGKPQDSSQGKERILRALWLLPV